MGKEKRQNKEPTSKNVSHTRLRCVFRGQPAASPSRHGAMDVAKGGEEYRDPGYPIGDFNNSDIDLSDTRFVCLLESRASNQKLCLCR